MTVAYLGLGANLGDARQTLKDTIVYLAQQPSISVIAKSSFYKSQPIDAEGPDFFNAVICIETTLIPEQLHAACAAIELEFGRERLYRNAPRTLDIDLLLYGDVHVDLPTLHIPHPRMTERAFVLLPLAELAPAIVIPGHGEIQCLLPNVSQQVIEKIAFACPTCPFSSTE